MMFRKTKIVLSILFCVACVWVAFLIPPETRGGFFIGAFLGWLGGTVAWFVTDWQLFMMEKEKERV